MVQRAHLGQMTSKDCYYSALHLSSGTCLWLDPFDKLRVNSILSIVHAKQFVEDLSALGCELAHGSQSVIEDV